MKMKFFRSLCASAFEPFSRPACPLPPCHFSYFKIFAKFAIARFHHRSSLVFCLCRGWSGGAMVLGKLPVPGRPTIWMIVGQGPIVPAVGAGGGCLDIFTLVYPFSPLSPFLWETARYRLKYCLKGPLNPKQPTTNCCFCNWRYKLQFNGRGTFIRLARARLLWALLWTFMRFNFFLVIVVPKFKVRNIQLPRLVGISKHIHYAATLPHTSKA